MIPRSLRPSTALLILGVIAVALRIGWQIRSGFFSEPPVFEEDEIARNILAGRGHSWEFLGTRWTGHIGLFPSLLALLHFIDGGPSEYRLIGILQSAVSLAVVGGAFYVGTQLWSRPAGVLAALGVALHPAMIVIPARGVIAAPYDQALSAVVLAALLAAARHPSLRTSVYLGLGILAAVLLRPSIAAAGQLSVLPLMRRGALVVVAAAAASLIAGNAVVALRTQSDHPAGAMSAFCLTLWLGNNPESSGGAANKSGRSQYDEMPAELRQRLAGKGEAEQGRIFCDAAVRWMLDDPLRTAAWQLTKLWHFWWFPPFAGALYPDGWIDVYRVAYVVQVALAVGGAVMVWRNGWRDGLIYVVAFMTFISVLQAVFYVEGRHRLLVEVGITALAAVGTLALFGPAKRTTRLRGGHAALSR